MKPHSRSALSDPSLTDPVGVMITFEVEPCQGRSSRWVRAPFESTVKTLSKERLTRSPEPTGLNINTTRQSHTEVHYWVRQYEKSS